MTQLWLNGNDQSTLDQNQSLMQGIYFYVAHVPFTAPTSLYPGLKVYLTEMKKYEPTYVYDELAIQGWESAALFVQGVKMAGDQPHTGQRDQRGQLLDGLHGRRTHGPGQLEERRAHRPRTAVLRRLIKVVGRQVRAGPQHGEERVQLLPVDQPEEGPGLPRPARHARSRLIGRGGG